MVQAYSTAISTLSYKVHMYIRHVHPTLQTASKLCRLLSNNSTVFLCCGFYQAITTSVFYNWQLCIALSNNSKKAYFGTLCSFLCMLAVMRQVLSCWVYVFVAVVQCLPLLSSMLFWWQRLVAFTKIAWRPSWHQSQHPCALPEWARLAILVILSAPLWTQCSHTVHHVLYVNVQCYMASGLAST